MKSFLFAAALLVGCSPAAQGQSQNCTDKLGAPLKSAEPKPLIVLLESDPWAMVIGSDSPKLALYSDGQVIYRTDKFFKSIKLSQEESTKFQATLHVDALACVLGSYEASDVTDQPTRSIFLGRGGKLAQISVYGEPEGPKVPTSITSAYEKLAKFDHPGAKQWLPEKVEVMLWAYEYAPEKSIIWPKDWPGLDGPDAIKRGDSFSIYLPAADYPRLVAFLGTRKEKGAVEIGGKKWAADVRFPFPGEEQWMRSNDKGN